MLGIVRGCNQLQFIKEIDQIGSIEWKEIVGSYVEHVRVDIGFISPWMCHRMVDKH